MDQEVRFDMNDDDLHYNDAFGRIGFVIKTEFTMIRNGSFDKVCSSGVASHLGHQISVGSILIDNKIPNHHHRLQSHPHIE